MMMQSILFLSFVSSAFSIDCSFNATYPRQYIAYKSNGTDLVIDGQLSDPAWTDVAFTESFVDISTSTTPKFQTHAKIRWDDTYLYIGAKLQDEAVWANITTTCHCLNASQDQVIFHDNDWEMFVDAPGSNHYYKEIELNAANATWDLALNKPYGDSGYENSSRVFGPQGFDMQPPLHCATHVDGSINNPSVPVTGWTVEVALPLSGLVYNTSATIPPTPGSFWRINFSRVEWAVKVIDGKYQKYPSCQSCPVPGTAVEDNWVWSPQGSIAMHLPDKWGILQFAEGPVNATAAVRYPEWPVRSVAMALYYAEHAYASALPPSGGNGTYTSNLTALAPFAEQDIFAGICTVIPSIQVYAGGSRFNATVVTLDGTMTASITDDRFLVVSTSTIPSN